MTANSQAHEGVSRRDFLKIGAIAGGAVGVTSLFGSNVEEAQAKSYDTIDEMIEFDSNVFERYDANRMSFARSMAYSEPPLLEPDDNDDPDLLADYRGETQLGYEYGAPGYEIIDYAFTAGGCATLTVTGSGVTASGMSFDTTICKETDDGEVVPIGTLYGQKSASFPAGGADCFNVNDERYEFDDPSHASYAIKKAAKIYGASLVGIAPYDERFIFKSEISMPSDLDGNILPQHMNMARPIDIESQYRFLPKSVIVLAFEMDYEGMKVAGGQAEVGTTQTCYGRMAEVGLRVATFLRGMGYNTLHCGNNISPSVAEAIRAGLGEGGRNSVLVTEEYGPRVRLAKVYTDLECEYDKPKSFGVTEFCEVCQVCADTCPSEAITKLSIDDPENVATNICAQAGVRKYYLNAQKCSHQWNVLGGNGQVNDCGICITVCPYNKPQTWNHELVKVVTRIPGLNSMARYFDHFFGFGNVADEQLFYDFWRKDV